MPNLYTDLLTNLAGKSSPTQAGAATDPYAGFKWNMVDPSQLSFGTGYTDFGSTLKDLGFNDNPYLENVSYDGGVNGNQQTSSWGTNPAFIEWLNKNGYKVGHSYGGPEVDGRGAGNAYNGIFDANGNLLGANSYGYNNSNSWVDTASKGALAGMLGGAAYYGAGAGGLGGADAASAGAGGEGAFLGGEGSMGLTAQEIQAGVGTGGLTGSAPVVSTAGVNAPAGMAVEDAAKIGAIQGAAGQMGTTWGIPNNVLGTGIAAGSQLLGGVLQNNANKDALDAQMKAASESNALLKYMYDTQRSDQAPWMEAGKSALGKLTNLLNSGELTSKFAGKFDPAAVQMDPGYQFGLDQGQKAIQNSAAARGMGLSGSALKDAARFGNDYATTKYDDAYKRAYGRFNDDFNRFYAEKDNMLNPLFKLSGLGQSATNQVQQAGTNYANNASNNAIGLGNASAANMVNRGNIYGNVLANLGGLGYQYFNP